MKRSAWLALAAAVALGACARPTPEQQIVNDAAGALGGAEAIQAAKTLLIEGEGTNYNLGQDMNPEAASQTFGITAYTRAIDVAGGRVRIEQTRTPTFAYFAGQAPVAQVLGLDGEVGYNVAPNGTATRVPDAAARDRRMELYHHPLTLMRVALDPMTTLANARTEGTESVVDVTTAGGLTFTLAIDGTTKLPARVASRTDNTNLGDVTITTSFADYQEASGLQLPTRLTTKTDDVTTAEIRVTSQMVDAEVGDLAAPPAAAEAAPIAGPAPATVTAEEVSKGIWWLAGQSHHSVLVEFSDHLMLIEAPQNDTRALAVIAKARELRPDKPLTQVVLTHHHFDHSGGVRAAISEGLTIVAHESSADFLKAAAARPHTIAPDALALNAKPVTVETVGDERTFSDDTMTVTLSHVAGNPHADTLLMAYFPGERIVVEGDVFSPGNATSPFAPNFLENVQKRRLRVDRIVPIHGTIAPFGDLVKTVQAQATASN